eukprot:1806_1
MGAQQSTTTNTQSVGSSVIKYPEIQRNLRLNESRNLKCVFVEIDKHPEMLLFAEFPQFDDDSVVGVDMVYKGDPNVKNCRRNVVRVQGNTWGRFKNDKRFEIQKQQYVIAKTMQEIVRFCIQYQDKNPLYSYSTNNCRKFMIEFCNHIGVTWSGARNAEEFWYNAAKYTNT